MAKKIENYTAEMTADMVREYGAAENDSERKNVVVNLAQEFGKTVASVRMKLVREGVYVKAANKTKDGKEITSKAKLVGQIAGKCNCSAEQFDSLEKANKRVLEEILLTLAGLENDVTFLKNAE